ncbi:pantetheine-phosphate adenylyltransferase [mine drainage metagenome]|uniref:Phosphopantetheine adenylyltransferase n=1 Tax=mine drainage metagenome TaxID=410659 RepID=T1A073_9ZZZZ
MNGPRIGVYAGSFDPPTNGHVWMIKEGAKLFDKLIIAIGENSEKRYSFSIEQRIEMLKGITKGMDNVSVTYFENMFLVDYAKKIGAKFILRGIRDSKDYEYEKSIRSVNEDIGKSIMTVFLMPPNRLSAVSSSLVKGLVGTAGWERVVKGYVPSAVVGYLKAKYDPMSKKGAIIGMDNE